MASRADEIIRGEIERLNALADAAEAVPAALTNALDSWRADSVRSPERVDLARQLALATARAHHAVTAAAMSAAGAVEQLRVHRADAERTSRVWLARHVGVSHREAGAWCRGAQTLERFPSVEETLTIGEIAPGHVDALAGIIPARMVGAELASAIELLEELMPTLLRTARSTTVDEFERFCNHVRARLDQDGAPDRSGEPSRVWLSKLFNGRHALTGDLSADDGVLFRTFLDEREACRRAAARNAGESAAPSNDPLPRRLASELAAEALMSLLRDGAASTKPGRVGLFLHIDLDDLNGRVPDTAHTESNLDLTDDTLWKLMVDGDVTPIFTTDGQPLSFGRTRRLAPPILRRFLAHRDRHCRFAWCDAPPVWSQSHHIQFWDDGGLTDADNNALECTFHHHEIHDHGWTMSGTPPDVTITRPDGTPHTDDQQWRGRERERRRADVRHIVARLEREKRRLALVA